MSELLQRMKADAAADLEVAKARQTALDLIAGAVADLRGLGFTPEAEEVTGANPDRPELALRVDLFSITTATVSEVSGSGIKLSDIRVMKSVPVGGRDYMEQPVADDLREKMQTVREAVPEVGELHFPEERLLGAVFGSRLADYVEENWPGFRVEGCWSDMAGEHGNAADTEENWNWNREMMRVTGWTVRPQRIGTNRIQPRLEAQRAALAAPLVDGQPGMLIDPRCTFLIRGYEARYVWTEEVNKSGDKRKVPDKSFTEANVMDADQYLKLSEHKGDGSSPYSHMNSPDHTRAQQALTGRPPMPGENVGGLQTGWNLMDPYAGERA